MRTRLTSGQLTAMRGLFFAVTLVVVVAWALFCSGCQWPQWRVGQATIDVKTTEKPAAQVEGEKRAASFIAKRTAPPVVDAPAVVADVHQVATGLTASLGEPKEAVKVEDKDAILKELRGALVAKDKQIERWREFGRKYAGKPLEDTGINLAGPAGVLALAGVIAACVFIPGAGYAMLRLLPVLWGMVRRMTVGIESFAAEMPAEGAKLKQAYLARKMDTIDKRIVKGRKRTIKPDEITATATA